jgi:hypothetical protein
MCLLEKSKNTKIETLRHFIETKHLNDKNKHTDQLTELFWQHPCRKKDADINDHNISIVKDLTKKAE